MAEIYWHGNGGDDDSEQDNIGEWDFDDSEISNWRNVSDDTGADMPDDGDIVHFDSRAYANGTTNTYQAVINGNQTEWPNLNQLHVHGTYNGAFGLTGTPIEIVCSSGTRPKIIYEGTGYGYIKLANGYDTEIGCTRLIVNIGSTAGSLTISSEINDTDYSSKWDLIQVAGGALELSDDTSYSKMEIIGSTAIVTIGTGCLDQEDDDTEDRPGTIWMFAGTCTSDSPLSADSDDPFLMTGGTFYWGTEANADEADMDCILARIFGGTFYWQVKDDDTSIITKFEVWNGGTLDASGSTNAGGAKEVGDSTQSEVWNTGQALFNNGGQNISVGASSDIIGYGGGTITTPDNESISW